MPACGEALPLSSLRLTFGIAGARAHDDRYQRPQTHTPLGPPHGSLLRPLAIAITTLLEKLLDSHGGALGLAADPATARVLCQLLPEPRATSASDADEPDAKSNWFAVLSRRIVGTCQTLQVLAHPGARHLRVSFQP